MQRREFIGLIGGAAASPLVARAQQPERIRRIGFVGGADASLIRSLFSGFLKGMSELGYTEGKDFIMEWRFAEGHYERFPDIAAELVRLKVDVFVLGTPAALRPVQKATRTIPIVMGYSVDPVGNGFVESLARPGGNVTGLSSSLDDVIPKQIDLLAMAVPNLSRIGLLTNPSNPTHVPVLKSAKDSTQKAGFVLVPVEASNPDELETAIAALTVERVGAVIVIADGFFNSHRGGCWSLCSRTGYQPCSPSANTRYPAA